MGIEFPVATKRLEENTLVLSHAPGRCHEPNQWYDTHKAVYGAAPTGQEKEAFQRYIANLRVKTHGFRINYNS